MPKRKTPRPRPPTPATSPARTFNWILPLWLLLTAATFAIICSNNLSLAVIRLSLEGAVLFMWLAAAVGFGWLLANRAAPDARLVYRTVTAAALGIGIMSLIILLLGLAGALNRVTAAAIIAVGIGLLLLGIRHIQPKDIAQVLTRGRDWRLWPLLLTGPAAGFALATALVPAGLLWPNEPNGYDVVEYHLQIPRQWFDLGRIVPLHENVFSFFPMNVELHYLLAMHLRGGPWAGMYLAQLMHCAMLMLTAVAVFAIVDDLLPASSPSPSTLACGELGRAGEGRGEGSSKLRRTTRLRPAATAALLAATTPWFPLLAGIAYDEGGLLLFGTLSLGWILRVRPANGGSNTLSERSESKGAPIPTAIIAGALAGFACGSKLTAVPEILLAFPFALLIVLIPSLARDRAHWRHPIKTISVFLLTGLLTFSPWLIRNQIWAHNPVFPEAASLLGPGHFTPAQVRRWQLAHQPRPDQLAPSQRLAALVDQTAVLQPPRDATFGYALPILLPLLLLACIKYRTSPAPAICLIATLAILVFWLTLTHLQGRFLVIVIPIIAIGISLCPAPRILAQAALVLAILSSLAGAVGLWQRWADRSGLTGTDMSMLIAVDPQEMFIDMNELKLRQVPKDQRLVLVGDARAFFYVRPSSLLGYRTVFDVDARGESNAIEAWSDNDPGQYLLVDPEEVIRLNRTYFDIPPLPTNLHFGAGVQPFVLQRRPASAR